MRWLGMVAVATLVGACAAVPSPETAVRCFLGQEAWLPMHEQAMTHEGIVFHEVPDPAGFMAQFNAQPPATNFRVPDRIVWYERRGGPMIFLVMVDRGCIVAQDTMPAGAFGLGTPGQAI